MGKLISRVAVVGGLIASSLVVVIASSSPASSSADTPGLIRTQSPMCESNGSFDATSASWNWTKPTIEVSTDGTTWENAGLWRSDSGVAYGALMCREIRPGSQNAYWFIIGKVNPRDDDMGAEGLKLTFRITIPVKSGDSVYRLTGYSDIQSYSESNGVIVVVTKASPVAKVDYGPASRSEIALKDFITAHPECVGFTMSTINKCAVRKATRDRLAAVMLMAEFFTSGLSSFRSIQKGLWIAANVNGYTASLLCAGIGSDTGSSDVPTTSSLEVAVTGTPHFRADGVTLNSANLKVFIPKETAVKCFGDGDAATTMDIIAKKLTVTRTETSVASSSPVFTASVMTAPVEGIMVVVEKMTFSDPKYTLASLLKSAGVTTGSTSSKATTLKVAGKTATISVTLTKTATFKIYKKVKNRLTLVKTVSGKVGINKVVTAYVKGYSYVVKDSKNKTLATLSK